MENLLCRTRNNESPEGKLRVYFACHPEDFSTCLDPICEDILKTLDCAVYYEKDLSRDSLGFVTGHLEEMDLVVYTLTSSYLDCEKDNFYMCTVLSYTREVLKKPLLPLTVHPFFIGSTDYGIPCIDATKRDAFYEAVLTLRLNELLPNGEKKDLVIPEGVTELNCNIFKGCHRLRSVTLPDSLLTIAENAFCGCDRLESVRFGSGLRLLDKRAFYYCTSLEEVILPDSLQVIRDNAFACCMALDTVLLGSRLESVGYAAFTECAALETIMIPQSVECLGKGIFRGCTSLKTVYGCPEGYSLEYLGLPYTAELYYRKDAMKTLVVPGEKDILPEEHLGRDDFRRLFIEDGVERVGERAFACCFALKEAILPKTASVLGREVFGCCTALKTVRLSDRTWILPEGLFIDCFSLTAVEMPTWLKAVGDNAFAGCGELKEVNFPQTLEDIGRRAFFGCRSLKRLALPDNLRYIGARAFADCIGLEEVILPGCLYNMYDGIFAGCPVIKKITVPLRFKDSLPLAFPDTDLSKVEIIYK